MIKNQISEEYTKIREGLHRVSLEYCLSSNKPLTICDLPKDITEEEEKLITFNKIFRPITYKSALKEIERLNNLKYLWTKEDNLVKLIESETSKNISSIEIDSIRTKINSLEAEYLSTPQFQNSSRPSSTLYKLKFQFPDFVEQELKPLLNAPAKDIKWLKTGHTMNDQFNCLVEYAKENKLIAEKAMEKMVEVYRLNKGSKKGSYALFSVGVITLESDALYGVFKLGKALGYTEEELNQRVELK